MAPRRIAQLLPPWTTSSQAGSYRSENLSESCQIGLRSLCKTFEQIEYTFARDLRKPNSFAHTDTVHRQESVVTWRPTGDTINSETEEKYLDLFNGMPDSNWWDEVDIEKVLLELKYVWAAQWWGLFLPDLLQRQPPESNQDQYRQILDHACLASDVFESIADELGTLFLDVRYGVYFRLSTLNVLAQRFENHAYLERYQPAFPKINKSLALKEVFQTNQSYDPTLLVMTGVLTAINILWTGLAWYHASPAIGSANDSDFWFTVQGTTTQLLSLFTILLPLWRSAKTDAWRWTWVFGAIDVLCSILALPLYLVTSTMWSSSASAMAAAAQSFVLLQIMLAVNESSKPGPLKKD